MSHWIGGYIYDSGNIGHRSQMQESKFNQKYLHNPITTERTVLYSDLCQNVIIFNSMKEDVVSSRLLSGSLKNGLSAVGHQKRTEWVDLN